MTVKSFGSVSAAFVAVLFAHSAFAENRFVSNDGTWKMKDEHGEEMTGTCYTSLRSAMANGHVIYVKSDYDCTVDTPVEADEGRYRYGLGGGVSSMEIRGETGDWRTGPTLSGLHAVDNDGRGTGACRVFSKTASNSSGFRLVGLRIVDGATESSSVNSNNGRGGLVRGLGANSRVTIEKCLLSGGSAADGGAVYFCTLVDCVVSNNLARCTGGGCYDCVLRNCTVISNHTTEDSTYRGGGGIYSGSASNCTIVANRVAGSCHGGGAWSATLRNCIVSGNSSGRYGGGVDECTTYNCFVTDNEQRANGSVGAGGGGSYIGTHYNSLFARNTANNYGGATYGGTYYNCTFACNTNTLHKNSGAGGLNNGVYVNCISYGNVGSNDGVTSATNSCLQVKTLGANHVDCINVDPRFVDAANGDYRPQAKACRNSGIAYDWMSDPADIRSKDLAGLDRKLGKAPDMGCYESKDKGFTVIFR